ncbi:MAG: MoaD/ThiS family protein [Elusimicrobia bacterium]|nr:MoaD/ThiS family protein [Elusimicrobiota bacterium]
MKVRVLLFSVARRLVGSAELRLEAPAGARVRDLLGDPRLAPLAPHLPSMRFALNEEFAPADSALQDGDVVAVIPPVSGG